MTKDDVAKLFTLFGELYPNKRVSGNLRLAWEYATEPYAYEDVRAAAIAYARENKYFPDVADITGGLASARNDSEEPERAARDRSWMRKYALPDNPDSPSRRARTHGTTWMQGKRIEGEARTE